MLVADPQDCGVASHVGRQLVEVDAHVESDEAYRGIFRVGDIVQAHLHRLDDLLKEPQWLGELTHVDDEHVCGVNRLAGRVSRGGFELIGAELQFLPLKTISPLAELVES